MTIKSVLKELCKTMTGYESKGRTIAAILKDINDHYLNKVPELVSIAITTPPNKTSYIVGEYFNTTGMVVTGTYDDGTTETIVDYVFSPNRALETSDRTITINYKGKIAKQAITVEELHVVGIEITTPPSGTTYTVGDLFDPRGMVVTATYNNGSTAEVTDYTWDPAGPLTLEDVVVGILYEGYTATVSITVTE